MNQEPIFVAYSFTAQPGGKQLTFALRGVYPSIDALTQAVKPKENENVQFQSVTPGAEIDIPLLLEDTTQKGVTIVESIPLPRAEDEPVLQ
jgi:hypothetical protein